MRLLKAERVLFAMLGLLILVTSMLAAGLPRLLNGQYDRSLRTWTRNAGTSSTDVWIRGVSGNRQSTADLANVDRIKKIGDELRGQLPPHLDQVAGQVSFNITSTGSFTYLFNRRKEAAFLGYDPQIPSRVRYVAGNAPHNTMPAFDPGQEVLPTATLQVGLSATAAQVLGLKVGDVVHLHGAAVNSRAPVIVVSGLYEPVSPKDPFWVSRVPFIQTVQVGDLPDPMPAATAVVDATGYQELFGLTDVGLSYNWYVPIDTSKITAATAKPVVKDIAQYGTQVANYPLQPALRLDTALDKVLQGFTSELSATQAILSLAIGGLGGVAAGVLLISVGVLLDRLRARLSVTRARGAGLWQLALSVGGTMAVWTAPAAALGYLAGVLLFDGRSSVLSVAGPVAVLLIAVVGPAIGAAVQHRRPLRETRADLTTARFGLRRLVLELLLVALAVAGTITLRLHGLKGGSNPLLSVTPVLLGAALGLIILRLYPYPLRALTALLGRGRSTVSYLGLAQAARQPARATLPALVLLLATAVAAFSGTVDSSIRHAQLRAAWQAVGADGEVTASEIEQPQIDTLRRLPGVTGAVPAELVQNVGISGTGGTATLVAIDLDAYRKLVAGHPISLPQAPKSDGSSALPALVSPGLAAQAGAHPTLSMADGTSYTLHVTGTIGSFPTLSQASPIVLVPYSALGLNALATTVFVAGHHLNAATLSQAGTSPGFEGTVNAQVESDTETGMTHAPLVGVMRDGFGYGALVMTAYGFLAVLMALMIGAERRGRTVSYLRTLGLSGRQLGLLGLLELAPTVLTAVVAGWALGLLLPVLVGSALDLTPYTSGFPVANRPLDASTALLMAGGLVVATGLAAAIDSLVNSRRRLGGLLRIGDQ